MNNILIGLGNIGKRYLDGILKVNDVHEIHILEKDKNLILDIESKRYKKRNTF